MPESDDQVNDLIDKIYPHVDNLNNLSDNERWRYFSERVILAAKNSDVDVLNEMTLDRLEGQEKIYHSADEAFNDGGVPDDSIPHEYLNTIVVSSTGLAIGRVNPISRSGADRDFPYLVVFGPRYPF